MARKGLAETEWLAALGTSYRTWEDWQEEYANLSEAVERAEAALRAWWGAKESEAATANGSRFNATMDRGVKDGLQQKRRRDVNPEGDTSQLVYVGYGANIRGALSRKQHPKPNG